jgi:LuxR family maltose regulon positive regulatory protein
MSTPLLTTKLYIPPVRPNLVSRPRLIERLNAGLDRKLTLISAPAGFGKTTLVTEWLNGAERPFTWLSLDESDNDPARFTTYFLAALQRVDPTIGQAAQAMLQAPQPPPPEAFLTSMINDVAAIPQPFVLVLDDYHLIHTLPIHQQLTFLLAHQPPQMHLCLVSREDPPLPLSRLRARGHTTEIRQDDLRFTGQETANFLRRVMRLELSSADVTALQQRTEGWVAGLQLAALSLRGRDDVHRSVQSFTGSHRYVLDYLIEEVFQRQPVEVQDFLLKTSILDRLTAPLCDAVAEREDSREVLLAMEQGNLFIVPLDESRQWYRYHHLFADLLRQQLRAVGMESLAPELHQRASQWYEAAGFPADAVQHALAGCDWERATSLIRDASGSLLNRGELMTLLGWLQSLPDEIVRAHSGLCLDYGWALILTGQINAAESRLEQAKRAACGEQSRTTQDEVARLGNVIVAQAYVARIRGDDRRTIELSEQALSLLPQDNLTGRSIATLNLGMAHWNSGHLAEAEQALTEADHAARQAGNHHARLTALCFLGRIQAARGNLYQAAESHRQAIRLGEQLPAVALVHIDLSALLYEWNDLEAAADHLQRGIELSRRSGNVEVQISGYYMLALTRQAQGDGSAALAALETAHRLARDNDVPPLVRAGTAACHAQIALAQGDLITATRWVEQMTDVGPSNWKRATKRLFGPAGNLAWSRCACCKPWLRPRPPPPWLSWPTGWRWPNREATFARSLTWVSRWRRCCGRRLRRA